MKTYPLLDKLHGHMYAFEIENLYIGVGEIVRILGRIDGVSNVQARGMFSGSSDVRAEFKYHDKDYVVIEPFGDNSRYWVGPLNSEDIKTDIHKVEDVFKQYRPPFIRELLGDVLSLRIFSRLMGKG
jgi:hypothetical protein